MDTEPLADFVGRKTEEFWRAKLQTAELEAVADAAQAVCDWYKRAKPWLYISADHVPLSLMHKLQCVLEDAGRTPHE